MSWNVVRVGELGFLAYTYVDRQAGPSAKGVQLTFEAPTDAEALAAASRPDSTVRLGPGITVTPLAAGDVDRLGLPAEPEWMSFDKGGGPWNTDPRLAGQFHAQLPDDLQATFSFLAARRLENMWVRLDRPVPELDAYEGQLLNTAHADPAIAAGMRVLVRPTPGLKMPIWLSPDAEQNLRQWTARCEECGFDLVLESMSALVARQFPDAPMDSTIEAFTTRCAQCGGGQLVKRRAPLQHRGEPILTPRPIELAAILPPRPRRGLRAALVTLAVGALAALAWWVAR